MIQTVLDWSKGTLDGRCRMSVDCIPMNKTSATTLSIVVAVVVAIVVVVIVVIIIIATRVGIFQEIITVVADVVAADVVVVAVVTQLGLSFVVFVVFVFLLEQRTFGSGNYRRCILLLASFVSSR